MNLVAAIQTVASQVAGALPSAVFGLAADAPETSPSTSPSTSPMSSVSPTEPMANPGPVISPAPTAAPDTATAVPVPPPDAQHPSSTLVWLIAIAGLLLLAKVVQKRGGEETFRKGLMLGAGACWLAMTAYFFTQPTYEAYPLHLCRLAGLVAIWALWKQAPWARGLLYFWALALTSQAFITPVNTHPITHVRWWFFWESHSWIIAAALYDVCVLGYRPKWCDLKKAVGLSVVYIVAMFCFNVVTKLNYGYVGPTDDQPGLLAQLGPWPWRVLWMCAMGVAAFVLVWVPWPLVACCRKVQRGGSDGEPQQLADEATPSMGESETGKGGQASESDALKQKPASGQAGAGTGNNASAK